MILQSEMLDDGNIVVHGGRNEKTRDVPNHRAPDARKQGAKRAANQV